MTAAVEVTKRSLNDLWSDLWTVAVCNLLWGLCLLLILPGPPATVALAYYTNRLAHGEVADVGDFLGAIRRYWGTGWRWALINGVAIFILGGDVILTGRLSTSAFARFAQGGFAVALAAWLFLQIYALAFLHEQERPAVVQALRNGAAMLGNHVGFSLALALIVTATFVVGGLLFMVALAVGGVFLTLVGNHAVLNRLEDYRSRRA